MTKRVALVTCASLPGLDPDDQLLIEPLRARGIEPHPAVWDDPAVAWHDFDLAVIRNPWDYPGRRDEFVAWARSVPRLANPADVIAWNTDKRYLSDLAAAGIPVVPTTWLTPGEVVVLPAGGRHVLKPSVGAGSIDAAAFSMHYEHEMALALEHAERLLGGGRSVMVQPYLERIEERGETGLIFLGRELSHVIAKGAMLHGERGAGGGGLYRDESIRRRDPTAAELDVARRALAAVPGGPDRLLYARVDLVPGHDDRPLLIELELTEPSLFMTTAAGSAERFAAAIAARL
jgi:hypothetical protein